MKKMLLVILALAIPATVMAECKEPPKADLKTGMKVVAQWQGDNWWVAKIDSIKNGKINVTYSDNTKGKNKNTWDVLPYPNANAVPCFKKGDQVVSKWKNDSWWVAKIDKIDGNYANVTYSDGEKGRHTLSEMVRAPK